MNPILSLIPMSAQAEELLRDQPILKRLLVDGKFDEIEISIVEARLPRESLFPPVTSQRAFRFTESKSTKEIERAMASANHTVSHAGEAFEYCTFHAEAQLIQPIIALGTTIMIRDEERVLCFYGGGRKRGIYALRLADDWGPGCAFLGWPLSLA